jgi:DNA-binding MarR family transcriptional regulator
LGSVMDGTFFGLKRAYHGTLRVARVPLWKLGLTSARFDLLFAMTRDGMGPGESIWQSGLRRLLGISRQTVSRMLQSLEALGLVRRRRSRVDRRQVVVDLNPAGWERIRDAYQEMTTSDWAFRQLDAALGAKPVVEKTWGDMDPWVFDELSEIDGFLSRLRRGFGDFSRLVYPWYPIDESD